MLLPSQRAAAEVGSRRVRLHVAAITDSVATLERLASELGEADAIALRAFVAQVTQARLSLAAMSDLLVEP